MTVGTIYLLHFDEPYHHAKHYVGWTSSLSRRIAQHRAGKGSKLLAAVVANNIGFSVAATWKGDRHAERRRHRSGGAARYCPTCQASAKVIKGAN